MLAASVIILLASVSIYTTATGSLSSFYHFFLWIMFKIGRVHHSSKSAAEYRYMQVPRGECVYVIHHVSLQGAERNMELIRTSRCFCAGFTRIRIGIFKPKSRLFSEY